MRKRIVTAAVAASLLAGATGPPEASADEPASHSPARQEWRQIECRYGGLTSGGWTQREVVLTIACAEDKWSVAGGLSQALAVARCESGLRADAWNPGGYAGVFQHAIRYWPGRLRSLAPRWDKPLGASAFNGRSNIVVAIRMAHGGGWSAWSCA